MGIELQNITKHYRVGVEQIRALDGVSLRVGDNEYVAVMGELLSVANSTSGAWGSLSAISIGTPNARLWVSARPTYPGETDKSHFE